MYFGEGADVVTEIERAFGGFFDTTECDLAYRDHNLDPCEAAYQLACDAEENRYKLTLPLTKSVLLCESLIISEPSGGKKGGGGGGGGNEDVQVAEDSLLSPNCLFSGKWVINGDNISYYSNVMSQNTPIHVFSTNDEDEKPMIQMQRTKSTPLPKDDILSKDT
jgi:hypothetical protein